MGNTCACIRQSSVQGSATVEEQIQNATRASSKEGYVTASSGGGEHGSAPCSSYLAAQRASGGGASVEEQIERSKSHWSSLEDQWDGMSDEDEVAEESNKGVFKTLQLTRGQFFCTFGYGLGGYNSMGELKVGEKFAEGGQAELFHAQVTWRSTKYNERDVECGLEWVVKIFKKGTYLRHLQCQLPHGFLQFHEELIENAKSPTPRNFGPRTTCEVKKGILLEDGRFAFLMVKEHFDMRTLIERNMRLKVNKKYGPFSKKEARLLMFQVAEGVNWLHGRDIIHRDLKASNVLIRDREKALPKWHCYVADFECSIGVVGTGFFRAPEILQACKEGNVNQKHDVFTKAADVYSYGMTCYEILTGKLPFEGYATSNYDVVLKGGRPVVPKYVEGWIKKLLCRCWESNPKLRPTTREILDIFIANSRQARKIEEANKKEYGCNFR